MREAFRRTTARAAAGLLHLGAVGIVLTTAIIGWQVFGRYVLNSSPAWAEQAALFLMIWYVVFAAAAGVREGFHIRILALENAVSMPAARAMRFVAHVVVGLCGAALVIWGSELVVRTWGHVIPTLGLPRGTAYLSLPASGALIVLFTIENLLEDFAGEPPPPEPLETE